MESSDGFILIYPETHQHLGIFEDLKDDKNVKLVVAKQKRVNNKLLKAIRRLHLSWTINKRIKLPFKRIWYDRLPLGEADTRDKCVIIVDGAMKAIPKKSLDRLSASENARCVLVCINSMDAGSIAMLEIRDKILQVDWNDIYSFDPKDVEKYGFKFLGNCYYSMHDVKKIEESYEGQKNKSDVYFTGGLKGDREQLILDVFKKLDDSGVKCDFSIMVSGERRLQKLYYDDKIHYYSGGWFPYEEVLYGVLQSNVIIEILQEGQHGPSLRYYEAVCYNKKLLTNNSLITSYPYYDSRYMKIISKIDDIDIEWIKEECEIDYHYSGEFSPRHLLKRVLDNE